MLEQFIKLNKPISLMIKKELDVIIQELVSLLHQAHSRRMELV